MSVQRSTFTWAGEAIAKKIRAATVRGLHIWAENLLQRSRELVPLDEGTLERSGVASVDEETLSAAVSYDTPYAVRQHEDMEIQHPNGRQAKYLEKPFIETRELALPIIQRQIRRVTGG
jgi:hypothetical protein